MTRTFRPFAPNEVTFQIVLIEATMKCGVEIDRQWIPCRLFRSSPILASLYWSCFLIFRPLSAIRVLIGPRLQKSAVLCISRVMKRTVESLLSIATRRCCYQVYVFNFLAICGQLYFTEFVINAVQDQKKTTTLQI